MARRVLIVDDEKTESAVMKAILAESGFEVFTIPMDLGGAEATSNESFDLVIIDLTMGNREDSEHLRRVRNAMPGATVLVMTDNGTIWNVLPDIADADFGIEYVKKPFSKDELLMSVRRAVCRARSFRDKDSYERSR